MSHEPRTCPSCAFYEAKPPYCYRMLTHLPGTMVNCTIWQKDPRPRVPRLDEKRKIRTTIS